MSYPNAPRRSVSDLHRLASLRQRAVTHLRGATTADAATAAAHALSVLHAMASSPATAAEALPLLHELQVHQVELDLQAQELGEARAELEAALCLHAERYDHLPVGCVTVDTDFVVCELNRRAALMLGVEREAAVGLPLAGLVGGDSLQRLRAAAADIEAGRQPAACWLQLRASQVPGRAVTMQLAADPAVPGYLLAMADTPDGGSPAAMA